MEQKFKKIAPGLYAREYQTADGGTSLLHYGRLKEKGTGKCSLFALGSDFREAKDKWQALDEDDRKSVLAVYPKWLARLAEFAAETGVSEATSCGLTSRCDRAGTPGFRRTSVVSCSDTT